MHLGVGKKVHSTILICLGTAFIFAYIGLIVGNYVPNCFAIIRKLGFPGQYMPIVMAPLVEEFAKALPLLALFLCYRLLLRSKTLARISIIFSPFSGLGFTRTLIFLGLSSGFGFGLNELTAYLQHGANLLERLPAMIFHPIGAAIIGYGLATRKYCRYYFLAVGLHFSFSIISMARIMTIAMHYTVLWGITMASWCIAWYLYQKAGHESGPEHLHVKGKAEVVE